MPMRWQDQAWSQGLWYQGKVTRRAVLGLGAAAAGALGAVLLEPPPWRAAFGQAKPYRIGSLQPLTGAAAAGGRMALIGTELAVRRINRAGGINGRPVELIVEDYQSAPDAGRRKAEKLATEDQVDAHAGGFLSNVCLACMPVWEEHQIVNMIGVCLDTTITTTKCSRYTFRPFDYAPAQAVAFAPYLVSKLGKKWHLAFADYSWGQSTKDAYAEQIKKAGGEVLGTTGIPLGIQKSGFKGREDSPKLIEALEGLEVKAGDDFPQGDKTLRKDDHQAFLNEFIFDIKGGKHHIIEMVPKEKTIFPPACKFA